MANSPLTTCKLADLSARHASAVVAIPCRAVAIIVVVTEVVFGIKIIWIPAATLTDLATGRPWLSRDAGTLTLEAYVAVLDLDRRAERARRFLDAAFLVEVTAGTRQKTSDHLVDVVGCNERFGDRGSGMRRVAGRRRDVGWSLSPHAAGTG